MTAAAMLLTLVAVPLVEMNGSVETISWRPLKAGDILAITREGVRQEVTAAGLLNLADPVEGVTPAYRLRVDTRMVEEAEDASIMVSFLPGSEKALPSFMTSEVVHLGGLSLAEMHKTLEKGAREAGRRMIGALGPHMAVTGRPATDTASGRDGAVFSFSTVDIGPLPDLTGKGRIMADPRRELHERIDALRELAPFIPKQEMLRAAVLRCALGDYAPEMRRSCIGALAVAARDHAPTQIAILRALREDWDGGVRNEAMQQSVSFAGLARNEAVQSWLYVISDGEYDRGSHEKAAALLAREGGVPNLEYAITRCLKGPVGDESLGKKEQCLGLLKLLPKERQIPAMSGYLARVPPMLQGSMERYAFQSALGKTGRPPPPEIISLLAANVEKAAAPQWMREQSLEVVVANMPCDGAGLDLLLRVLAASTGRTITYIALNGFSRFGKDTTGLRTRAASSLEALYKAGKIAITGDDVPQRIKRTIETLAPTASRER